MNEYFQPGSNPATSSPGSSAVIRAQFANIAAGFDKLPIMAGNANEFVVINATCTALVASGFSAADIATLDGIQTLTNKTLSWSDNTWVGFGTGATKDAGTLAGEVLLLAQDNKLPAMDAGNLTNIPGLSAKADANNAVLTGAPTTSTPIPGDNSSRIANTLFVNQALIAAGGAVPSANSPLMNGVANAGVGVQVSRDDHVHPSDTSRAPSSAATAAGTSFTPAGTVAASDVQAAIAELDTEKASLASPIFTGDPRAPTRPTSDNDTSLATTSFVHALLAQQPPSTSVSDAVPLMDGVAAAGTGVAASRDDHVHPTDTSRAPTAGPSFSGTMTHSGDIVLSGSGKRITGDFSNATTANRLMFQSSTVNGNSGVSVLPNGTGTTTSWNAYNSSDPTNASTATLSVNATQVTLLAGKTGTGTYLPLALNVGGADVATYSEAAATLGNMTANVSRNSPLTYYIGNGNAGASAKASISLGSDEGSTSLQRSSIAGGGGFSSFTNNGYSLVGTTGTNPVYLMTNSLVRLTVDPSGNILSSSPTGGLGYGAGAGGTVTQTTSKSTTVTLNRPCGQITMNAASLAANTKVRFTLINSLIAASDEPRFWIVSPGSTSYRVWVDGVATSACGVIVENYSAGPLSDAVVIGFELGKGSVS